MSLSWRDQYIAVLAPERVALVRRRRGWNGAFDLRLDAPWSGEPTAAAQALADLLGKPETGRGDLTLLVSNHYVRYLLVPWRAEVRDPEEFASYAEICCDQVYGATPGGRILKVSREKEGSPRLAAFLDASLMTAIDRAVAASRLRLTSVQPYLAAAFNRLGKSLPKGNFLFLVAEPARTCLLAARGGAWQSVRASAGEDHPDSLAALVEREAQLLGLAEGRLPPVFVHAPRQARLKMPECHGVIPESLSLPIPAALAGAADHLLTMAMAGA